MNGWCEMDDCVRVATERCADCDAELCAADKEQCQFCQAILCRTDLDTHELNCRQFRKGVEGVRPIQDQRRRA